MASAKLRFAPTAKPEELSPNILDLLYAVKASDPAQEMRKLVEGGFAAPSPERSMPGNMPEPLDSWIAEFITKATADSPTLAPDLQYANRFPEAGERPHNAGTAPVPSNQAEPFTPISPSDATYLMNHPDASAGRPGWRRRTP